MTVPALHEQDFILKGWGCACLVTFTPNNCRYAIGMINGRPQIMSIRHDDPNENKGGYDLSEVETLAVIIAAPIVRA